MTPPILTLDPRWLDRGFQPPSLTASPFAELPAEPRWREIWRTRDAFNLGETSDDLDAFAKRLVDALDRQIAKLRRGRIVVLVSGGYDSRIVAALLERRGLEPLYWGDTEEEPERSLTLDLLDVPHERRRSWRLDVDDPYQIADAQVDGWAPLYQGLRFFDAASEATLVTGLGGGEWFSYPAQDWLRGKQRRTVGDTLVDDWLDTWPQYWVLPDTWEQGFAGALHPYTTVAYAATASMARREWLEIIPGYPGELDRIRKAMLDLIDPHLAEIGWKPHRYDWRLGFEVSGTIEASFHTSWLAQHYPLGDVYPSLLDADPYAATMGGFAGWVDRLVASGTEIRVAE